MLISKKEFKHLANATFFIINNLYFNLVYLDSAATFFYNIGLIREIFILV